jgi:hypothetical protein
MADGPRGSQQAKNLDSETSVEHATTCASDRVHMIYDIMARRVKRMEEETSTPNGSDDTQRGRG